MVKRDAALGSRRRDRKRNAFSGRSLGTYAVWTFVSRGNVFIRRTNGVDRVSFYDGHRGDNVWKV